MMMGMVMMNSLNQAQGGFDPTRGQGATLAGASLRGAVTVMIVCYSHLIAKSKAKMGL